MVGGIFRRRGSAAEMKKICLRVISLITSEVIFSVIIICVHWLLSDLPITSTVQLKCTKWRPTGMVNLM